MYPQYQSDEESMGFFAIVRHSCELVNALVACTCRSLWNWFRGQRESTVEMEPLVVRVLLVDLSGSASQSGSLIQPQHLEVD